MLAQAGCWQGWQKSNMEKMKIRTSEDRQKEHLKTAATQAEHE